jgi:hypothetical protein
MLRILTGLAAEPAGWLLLIAAVPICVLAAVGAHVLFRRSRGRRSTLACFDPYWPDLNLGVADYSFGGVLTWCKSAS